MKNITFLSFLMLFLTMTLNAQHLSTQEELEIYESSLFKAESQKINSSSIEELLMRLSNAGPQTGTPDHLFSLSEMQILKSHFRSQHRGVMANIIPTAGATETFNVVDGDFFYDPTDGVNGGPGGVCTGTSSGDPGDYPNCGCVTVTTLTATDLSVTFLSFNVFGTFDWLKIYDGTDTSSPLLYDSNTNATADTFAGMVALVGNPPVFTSTGGSLTFEFNATAVVNSCGWEAEISTTGGGGGGNPATDFSLVEVFPAASPYPFGTSPIAGPFAFTPIGPGITQQVFAGDYDDNDVLYGLNFSNNTLITIDNSTGASSVVGPLTNLLTGHTVTGLSFNPVSGTMYALSTNGVISQIYSVNLVSGALTLVGSGTGNALGIWLEIDNAGNAYMADVGTDSLYSVNLATGTASVIGLLGIDINFAQDATIDPSDNTLYMAAYLTAGTSGIYTVNVATGLATFSHDTAAKEFGIIAIPATGGGGGGGGNSCAVTNPSNAFENGLNCSVNTAFQTANDVIVAADEDFTLEQITFNVFSNANISFVNVIYYADNAGLPGAQIGVQNNITPTSDNVIGSNFGIDVHQVVLDVNPFLFAGQVGVPTTYWIELAVDNVTGGDGVIFWEATSASAIGNPTALFDGFWQYFPPDNPDGVYTFSGQCDPLTIPNNWECADAFALTCGSVVLGSTIGATNSGGNASPDVFYKYTGSGDAEYVTISLCDGGTTYDSYLRVFASCGNLGVGNEIILNDDFCGLQSQVTFESDGTSTYIIMVEGFGTGSGDFSLAITCELIPVAECGGQFVDSGGPNGNYSNNENTVTTISPDSPDDYVVVTFTSFDVEASWDALYVYDGPDTSAPLISSGNPGTLSGFPAGGYYGNTIPGPFSSTHPSGALTFRFLSDGSVPRPGWIADITCLPVPPPNDLIVNAIDVDQFPQAYTDPAVRLQYATNELLNPQGCAIAGTNGVWYKFTATADGTAEASITTPSGVSVAIFYTAPNENVTNETNLTHTFEQTNQCGPGTSSLVTTVAGQSYYLYVLNTGGESDVVIDISNSLGTEDNVIDGFTFYPNPMDGVLNLRSKSSIDNVIIYNMLGQKIIDQNIGTTATQLQVSSLSTGAYLMKVVSQGQTATYRILKK